MEIADSIRQLLYKQDKVIIPGFGMFTCIQTSAKIHPTQHLFSSPAKLITFEKKAADDGVLFHYLMEHDNMAPKAAVQSVHRFVDDLKEELESKGKVTLAGIGAFQFDIEKHLNFIQDTTLNFLTTSYGLEQFISQPILRRNDVEEILKPTKKQKLLKATKENSILLWLLITFMFAALASVYFIFKSGIIAWFHSWN